MQTSPLNTQEILNNLRPLLLLGLGGLGFSLVLTPIYTSFAYKFKWWKKQRETSISGENATVFNKMHHAKHMQNIPTMAGGVGIVALLITTLWFNLDRAQTYLPLAAMSGAGLLGLIDDVVNLKSHKKGTRGLSSSLKFVLMTLIAALLAYWFIGRLGYTSVHVPFNGDVVLPTALMAAFIVFVIVGTANAVNITDGLDGLAGGLLMSAYGTFGLIAFLQGNFGLAGFCFTVVGTLISYVWFNIFPARFFMGDVGSFALGTGLAVVAIMTNSVLLVPIVGFVFVFEVFSVVLQLLSKKFLKRKIFLSAPIHHHFEAKGWPEAKVTMRFWVIGQVAAVAGILLAVWGGFAVL
jgi:phospho-N-acetylmuramoyl-pentapeptide-transferase